MKWAEIQITVPAESVEAVIAALLEAGCQGVAERGSEPRLLTGYLPPNGDLEGRIDGLEERLLQIPEFGLSAPLDFQVRNVEDADWANQWKQHYKPLEIGTRLAIKPTWELYDPGGRVVVELDPGMAFGTGGHPTTRLCLEILDELVWPGSTVADIGTGSGILALAAARLGAARVYATDIDSLPRKIARENVTANGLDSVVLIQEMDEFDRSAKECDLIVANILASTIVDLLPSIRSRLNPGGAFVGAGIVEEKLTDVLDALQTERFVVKEVRSDEIWRAVIARSIPECANSLSTPQPSKAIPRPSPARTFTI